MLPESKLDKLRAAWARGDRIGALRIASHFWDRSPETQIFKRGWDAHNNPNFFRQIKKDPAALTELALATLAAKFNLPSQPNGETK